MTNANADMINADAETIEATAVTPSTSVETANNIYTVEMLEAGTKAVRDQFRDNLRDEAEAANSAEERHAALLALGYSNALAWLQNKDALYTALGKINLTPESEDRKLLAQIARLQLGHWKENAAGNSVWSVQGRRNERQARFYQIFFDGNWKVDGLRTKILQYKGRTGGILQDAKTPKVTISAEERADNYKLASKAAPLGRVETQGLDWGKAGEYVLVLARVQPHGLDVLQKLDGVDALTERTADSWAAKTALTIPSDAA